MVAAAEGSKFQAVFAVPTNGDRNEKTTPAPAGTGKVHFVVDPSLMSTVIAVAEEFAIVISVNAVLIPLPAAAIH